MGTVQCCVSSTQHTVQVAIATGTAANSSYATSAAQVTMHTQLITLILQCNVNNHILNGTQYIEHSIHRVTNCFPDQCHGYVQQKLGEFLTPCQEILATPLITSLKPRHTVVCKQPRKMCCTQVCYLQEPSSHHFQHLISL